MIPIRDNNMIKNTQIIALFKSFEEIQRVNKLILVALEKRMAQWKGLPKNQQRLGDIFTQLVSVIPQVLTSSILIKKI
jgi:hypothetical protein